MNSIELSSLSFSQSPNVSRVQENTSFKKFQGRPVAPEAVWQIWQPPYQSEIWYGGATPICWNLGSWFSGKSL